MNKELSFKIENIDLYLEQTLVDYMDIPIFFLCKGEEQYYLALCTDIDELNYIVVKLSLSDAYNLLHGKTPMRDVILKQNEYWDIISGDEICLDVVTKKSIDEMETALLPEDTACFKILTKQMELYVQKFDREFFDAKNFYESDKKADLSEWNADLLLDVLVDNIEQLTELVNCKLEKPLSSNALVYCDEKMNSFIKSEKPKPIAMDDLFKLAESCVNNIAVAA
jgi:hypothetical protein